MKILAIEFFKQMVANTMRIDNMRLKFSDPAVPKRRHRATKKGMRHIVNPAGTKMRRMGDKGTIGCRHGVTFAAR